MSWTGRLARLPYRLPNDQFLRRLQRHGRRAGTVIDGGVLAKAGGNVAFNVASALAMAGLSRCFDREVLGHDMLPFCPADLDRKSVV